MGIYDRDYYRERQPQHRLRGPQTIVGMLILINVVLFFANGLFTQPDLRLPPDLAFKSSDALTPEDMEVIFSKKLGWITYHMAVKGSSLTNPLCWWQFLTYGFAHSPPPDYWHLVGNMLVLFFLGRDVESLYGRKEFLRLYLAMLLVAAVAYVVIQKLQGAPDYVPVVGASGAVTGIVVLYALNFPRRILLLFFVIPMPAWVVGLLVVFSDVYGAINSEGAHIAYTAHLGGAAFALLYQRGRWNLIRLTPGWALFGWLKSRPKLQVHNPDRRQREDQELSKEVDRILEKLHREGEESLTRKERRTLESASRQYQKKRPGPPDDTP
ncbi:MAG: rhomboid family intramembrane serine protease [Planctomycetota bacterium]